jgi:NAD(P)H-hydrate epimerase
MQYVSAAQMAEVDDLAVNKFNIGVLQMMEHAGWNLAKLVTSFVRSDTVVHVLVGRGNNGGGGLCAARHLRNKGVDVCVVLSQQDDNGELIWHHLKTLKAMGVPIEFWEGEFPETGLNDVIVDALLGYNLEGDPREPISDIINDANDSGRMIVSLDLPSGLDPDTGKPGDPCIRASATLTLALPKKGFLSEASKEYVGWLYLGDIGIPSELYAVLGMDIEYPFKDEKIVRIG